MQLQDGVPAAGISGQGVREGWSVLVQGVQLTRYDWGAIVRLGGNDTFPLKQMFSGTAFIFSSVSLSGRWRKYRVDGRTEAGMDVRQFGAHKLTRPISAPSPQTALKEQ